MRVVQLKSDEPVRQPDKAEDDLDETLEETFPASDPPSNTPETGVRPEPPEDARDGRSASC